MSLITDSNFARVQLTAHIRNATPKLRRPNKLGHLAFALFVFVAYGVCVVLAWEAVWGMVG